MKIVKGNLLDVKEGIICHGVNAKGLMGAGIAYQIKKKWPHIYSRYLESIELKELSLGKVQYVKIKNGLWVANACTQHDPGPNADIRAIKRCFDQIMLKSKELNLPVNTCMIGCGIGGLSWDHVKEELELIETREAKEITVYVL